MVEVLEATRALADADDVADGLAILARELTQLFHASACMISRYDAERRVTTDWAGFSKPPGRLNRVAESYPLSGYPAMLSVLREHAPVGVTVGRAEYPEEQEYLRALGFGASLMLPLTDRGAAFGLIELFDRRRRTFSADEQRFARLCVDQAAVVLSAIRVAETLEHQDLAMVGALANALEAKDAATGHHAAETGELAGAVGEHLGLHGSELRTLRIGGVLHDIGKIGIPEAILRKPGALTDGEFAIIREHTTIGAEIISQIPGLADVIEIVRASHERWDGAGYPQGLAGEQIPVGSRIIAVCDAFHAMTEDRVYRSAMSPELALAELGRCSGTQFWPPAVDALEAIVRHGDRAVRYAHATSP
jgi:putative nucleotidyltransferase with HDIG domain